MAKFKPFHEFQKPLMGFTPEAFLDYVETVIPKDHLCRVVKEVVFSLDTEAIEAKYSFLGQRTYHPKLLLSVLFYGYATGLRSSRKLEERCLSDHVYIYLMQCYTPDHRTISDFRKNNLKAIEQAESNTQEKIKEVAADCGYGSYANYEYLEQRGIDGYVPYSNFQQYKSGEYQKEENRYHYTNFTYDSTTDSYVCPEGKRLTYWKTRTKKTESRHWNHKVYKGKECGACQKRSLCTKAKVRELLIDIREPLLRKMREKLVSDHGKRKYFMRQYIIEPIFGHLKFNVGYRNFLLGCVNK